MNPAPYMQRGRKHSHGSDLGWYHRARVDLRKLRVAVRMARLASEFSAAESSWALVYENAQHFLEARERARSMRAAVARGMARKHCALCGAVVHAGGALCSETCPNDERRKQLELERAALEGAARLALLVESNAAIVRGWETMGVLDHETAQTLTTLLECARDILEDVSHRKVKP